MSAERGVVLHGARYQRVTSLPRATVTERQFSIVDQLKQAVPDGPARAVAARIIDHSDAEKRRRSQSAVRQNDAYEYIENVFTNHNLCNVSSSEPYSVITSHQGGYALPGVCLSVCLFVCLQLYVKTTERIFVKILPQMYLWTRKN